MGSVGSQSHLLWFILFLLPLNSLAEGADKVVLSRAKDGTKISGISIDPNVEIDGPDFVLRARTENLDWQMLSNKKDLIEFEQDTGEFTLKVQIVDDEGDIEVTAISPQGEVERELIHIEIQHPVAPGELTKKEQKIEAARIEELISNMKEIQNKFRLGINYTTLTYKQTLAPDLKITTPTLVGGIGFPFFSANADISLAGYITTIPITMKPKGKNMYFGGFNTRIGYHFPLANEWRFIISAGLYYVTTIGRTDLGYVNVMGPQLYPVLIKTFSNASRLGAYVKYSPVSKSISSLVFSNNEMAAGAEYVFPPAATGFFSEHTIGISVNFSKLYLKYGEDISQTQTLGGGLTVGF